jgi:anhydro-N-acetylmuramic acid kinase
VGLISGTSADGIDAVRVQLRDGGMQVEEFRTVPYPSDVRERLFALMEDRATVREAARMHVLVGELFADAARQVMGEGVDLIASHGQTVAHLPDARATLQLGEPAVIAERTGCLTVADFRPADMAAGGEAAPLVPFFDAWLLGGTGVDRMALNLGGIANYTWIPADGPVVGGDTGPANVLMDALCERYLGQPYDDGGRLGAQGRVLPEILQELLAHPYIHRTGPRSTGREEFGREMAARLEGEPADLVRTAAAFSAESVALGLRRHLRGPVEVVVGGGGCENPTLMGELAQRLPEVTWRRFDEFGVPAGAREAAAFALMGHESAHGRPSNVPGVTGARGLKVLGKLVYP